MADLGYLDDPAAGWAGSEASRCGPPRWSSTSACTAGSRRQPRSVAAPGPTTRRGPCSPGHAGLEESSRRFELDRYLGWPGQAPSYKIGERLWLQIRDEAAQRAGADFDLKTFHKNALDLGSIGLDVLREAVLG